MSRFLPADQLIWPAFQGGMRALGRVPVLARQWYLTSCVVRMSCGVPGAYPMRPLHYVGHRRSAFPALVYADRSLHQRAEASLAVMAGPAFAGWGPEA